MDVIRQQDERDCGPACLAMIVKHFDGDSSLARIREYAGTDREGTTLLGLSEAATTLGLTATGYSAEVDDLRQVSLPVVLHWGSGHFVVCSQIDEDSAVLLDPAEGRMTVGLDELGRLWSGHVLVFSVDDVRPPPASGETSMSRLGRLGSLVRPRWYTIVEILLCSMVLALLSLSAPIVLQVLTDHVLLVGNSRTLACLMLAMVGLLIFSSAFSFLRRYLLAHLGRWLDITLMQSYYDHVMALPARFFTTRKTGEIISRFNDASKIREMLAGTAILSFVDVLMVIAVVILMMVYHVGLALVSLAFVPCFVASFMVFNPILRRRTRDLLERAADTQSHMVESTRGAIAIKSAAATQQACWSTDRVLGRMFQSTFRLEILDNGIETLASLFSGIGTIAVLWYGGHLVLEQQLSVGQLIAFYALVGMLLSPIERLLGLNRELQDAFVAADRLLEIMDLPTESAEDGSAITGCDIAGDIVLSNVQFHFPGQVSLFDNMSCTIRTGKTTAITGPSGAGKSTLCRLLNRLVDRDAGGIMIGPYSIDDIPLNILRRRVAYVGSEPFVASGTARDNIQLGAPEADFSQVVEASRIAQADEFIRQLPQDYDTTLNEEGSNLSTGQRIQLTVARAILGKPDVLILDESSSLLDPVTESRLFESLRAALPNLTLIVVTHRKTALRWIDDELRLTEGATSVDVESRALDGERTNGCLIVV